MYKPLIILVSISIIIFSLFALSDIQISDALFSPSFLRRVSKNDERIVTRRAKFDKEMIKRGSEAGLRGTLYILTSTMFVGKHVDQISRHVRVIAPLFGRVFLRIVTLPGQGPVSWDLPKNVEVDIREVGEEYGGSSRDSFQTYRRQWEEHYSLLPPSRSTYLLALDMDVPGRIFPQGILESVGYLDSHEEVSGIGFRTVVRGGRMYPERGEEEGWTRFLPERVPYARDLIEHSNWRMGIYRIPLTNIGKKILNTRMIYLIGA
jgi:hypothetical protein